MYKVFQADLQELSIFYILHQASSALLQVILATCWLLFFRYITDQEFVLYMNYFLEKINPWPENLRSSWSVLQGGLYPYRSSKAGLNAVTKSLSLDLAPLQVEEWIFLDTADINLKNVIVQVGALAVHPGWVQTDMGGKQAPLTAQVPTFDR